MYVLKLYRRTVKILATEVYRMKRESFITLLLSWETSFKSSAVDKTPITKASMLGFPHGYWDRKHTDTHFPEAKSHSQEWKELPGKRGHLHRWRYKQRLGRDVKRGFKHWIGLVELEAGEEGALHKWVLLFLPNLWFYIIPSDWLPSTKEKTPIWLA